jgi:hypothetical protein
MSKDLHFINSVGQYLIEDFEILEPELLLILFRVDMESYSYAD